MNDLNPSSPNASLVKEPLRRTQFDEQLLRESISSDPMVCRNHGRQMLSLDDGGIITAAAWAGDKPVLRIWRNHSLSAEHFLKGKPSAPVLLPENKSGISALISIENAIFSLDSRQNELKPVGNMKGVLQDAAVDESGNVLILLRDENGLALCAVNGNAKSQTHIDTQAGRACLDMTSRGKIHLVYEKRQGIEYRLIERNSRESGFKIKAAQRIAEAYAFSPAILAQGERIFIAYLGDSCRIPSLYPNMSKHWEILGRGGYIAAYVGGQKKWEPFSLAESAKIAKPLRATGDGGPSYKKEIEYRVRIEDYSAPNLVLGPDGVVQVVWANKERRWVYACRFLGENFSTAAEIRGPLEQLTGPCLMPKTIAGNTAKIPLAMVTQTRIYLDQVALPAPEIKAKRRIDFLQPDELAECTGLELAVNEMKRHPKNPVIQIGKEGSFDDAGLVADIEQDQAGWKAQYAYVGRGQNQDTKFAEWKNPSEEQQSFAAIFANRQQYNFSWAGRAVSKDGISWNKLDPMPLKERYILQGIDRYTASPRFLEDLEEKNPAWRYKGLWRINNERSGPWGAWFPAVSADGKYWILVEGPTSIMVADDDLRIWKDIDDIPERRFKATGIGWSHCARVCVQWTSHDGMHWKDERETLHFENPFGEKPELYTTGRILVDSWAGPDAEDEIHGGYVFRDGDRWLVHYMPWTADGHIYIALASSRDGIHFTRVGRGAPTLPLGKPGTWDSGRVALREGPFRVGNKIRQYYTGCGWKHGMDGWGGGTSKVGINGPNQMGCAEIQTGHWGHLQLARKADTGFLVTVPLLRTRGRFSLTLDLAGLAKPGSQIACAILDGKSMRPIRGFDFHSFDPISKDGANRIAKWKGKGMESVSNPCLRLAVRMKGHGLQLFGLNLTAK